MVEASPVDEAVAVMVQQVRQLRKLAAGGLLPEEDRKYLTMLTSELRQVEHGRASLVVAVLVGKRAVEGVPQALMERLLSALEGTRIPEAIEAATDDDEGSDA